MLLIHTILTLVATFIYIHIFGIFIFYLTGIYFRNMWRVWRSSRIRVPLPAMVNYSTGLMEVMNSESEAHICKSVNTSGGLLMAVYPIIYHMTNIQCDMLM